MSIAWLRPFLALAGGALLLVSGIAAAAEAQDARDTRKKLVLLIAEPEYETIATLPAFAAAHLQAEFRVVLVTGSTAAGENSFDHIEEIADADVLVVSGVGARRP